MLRERLYRYNAYFRKGHSHYLAFIIALANFVVIQYRLLIQNIPDLQILFPSLTLFVVVFIPIYLVVSTLIGWWDHHKGPYQTEKALFAEGNPIYRDLATALYLSLDGKNEEAKRILQKWTVNKEVVKKKK
ncbi:hypothetical protein HRbin01_01765 [archaeon HR01]|nr:hypothetical protein HRbin01_01765 [archaeon HR01]